MDTFQYDTLVRCEERHWYFQGQWAIARALLAAHTSLRAMDILDAGCGTGGTSLLLREFGEVVGVDVSPEALEHARRRALSLARATLDALPFQSCRFDLVTCFDVLYHRGVPSDVRALREMHRVLRPGGLLLVRVPALPWLRGAHDASVHARQRYTRAELVRKLGQAGLVTRVATYANTALLPLALAKRTLERVLPMPVDLTMPPRPLNAALAALLRLESYVLRQVALPLGVSVLALAERA